MERRKHGSMEELTMALHHNYNYYYDNHVSDYNYGEVP
jgi:hypothetical protein